MDPDSDIKVVVRCRPTDEAEDADHLTAVDVPEKPGSSAVIVQRGASSSDGLYQFNFSRVLDGAATQADMFQACGKDLVPALLDGRNAAVIAYGPSGAGKTHTMTGPDSEDRSPGEETRGLSQRLIEELFAEIEHRCLGVELSCLCVAVTDTEICDLLAEGAPDSHGAVLVDEVGSKTVLRGALEPPVGDASEAIGRLEAGRAALRGRGSSGARRPAVLADCRPHLVFALLLRPQGAAAGSEPSAKLSLVDLAGRVRHAARPPSAREAVHSSKSLAFLEQVMVASFKQNRAASSVPFRLSKLTHFLQDTLGGVAGSKTVLAAHIQPGRLHNDDTVATCRFAHRVVQAMESTINQPGVCPGLSGMHGDLFRLDPVMQGYLESVTAAAVAREKAKLLQRFQEQELESKAEMRSQLVQNEVRAADDLIKQLREKVEELEEMQEMTQMASEAARKGAVVDRETLLEMESLRKRLLELEAENAVVEVTVNMQPCSGEDPAMATQQQAIEETKRGDEELRELLQLKELRDRYRNLQEERNKASPSTQGRPEKEREELAKLKELARKVGVMFPGMSDEANREVIEQLLARVKQLEAANALGQIHPNNASMQIAGHAPRSGGKDPVPPAPAQAIPKKKTAAGKFRKGLSKVLKGAKSTRATASADGSPAGGTQAGQRLRAAEDAGATGEIPEAEDATPNIVVLNSLTHEQLMELIKLSRELPGPHQVPDDSFQALKLPIDDQQEQADW